MLFPDPERQKDNPGRYHRLEDGKTWQCEECAKEFDSYQRIIGHMGAHPRSHVRRPTGRPSNLMAKDVMAMTIGEMVDSIESLRLKVIEAEERGHEAIAWKAKIQALLNVEE